MNEHSVQFQEKLPNQAEVCARKSLEWLQKDLQGAGRLSAEEVFHLAQAADILLKIRDIYGKK